MDEAVVRMAVSSIFSCADHHPLHFGQRRVELAQQSFCFGRRLSNGSENFVDLNRGLHKVRFLAMQSMPDREPRLLPIRRWQIKFRIRDRAKFFDNPSM